MKKNKIEISNKDLYDLKNLKKKREKNHFMSWFV